MQRLSVVLLLHAVAALASTAAAEPTNFLNATSSRRLALTCSIETGVDYVGNDIANVAAASSSECCARCEAQSGCGAFTWTPFNGGTCWLKSAKGSTVSNSEAQSAVATAAAATCAIESGIDYIGNDIANAPGLPTDCCAKCTAQSGCGAFSWSYYNGGTCWLKSSRGATVTNINVYSGVVSAPTCGVVETGVDYVGNDIGSVAGSGAADCCTKCGKQAGCGAFTWSSWNGGTCWLKSSKGTTKASTEAVSSVLGSTAKSCPTVEQDVDYVDNDIGNVAGSGASDCCTKCNAYSGCSAFTWSSYNGGTCWLKSGKGSTKAATGAVSAVLTTGSPSPSPTTSTPAPYPTNHVQYKIRAGVTPARSVNLGGWLVSEYWMSKASPAWTGLDYDTAMGGEYIAMKKLGLEQGTKQFEAHRSTWIVESDVKELASFGLNTVRVAVGFWIVNDDPSTQASDISKVYAPGALKYLDKLVNEWAVKYNIAVMLSLHAHQGSQNGQDHSAAPELNVINWPTSQDNIDSSLQFATFLAARYKNSQAFLGMNLMNEPWNAISIDILQGYYKEAYKQIRATGNDCVLVVSPWLQQQGPPFMADFMRTSEYFNVWHEFHPYYKWTYEGQNEQQIIAAASTYRTSVLDQWTGNPIYIGEWSLGTWQDSAPFSNRTLYKQFASVQLQNYAAAKAGWSFWAWRNDEELDTPTNGLLTGWSMRLLLREGVFTVPT